MRFSIVIFLKIFKLFCFCELSTGNKKSYKVKVKKSRNIFFDVKHTMKLYDKKIKHIQKKYLMKSNFIVNLKYNEDYKLTEITVLAVLSTR